MSSSFKIVISVVLGLVLGLIGGFLYYNTQIQELNMEMIILSEDLQRSETELVGRITAFEEVQDNYENTLENIVDNMVNIELGINKTISSIGVVDNSDIYSMIDEIQIEISDVNILLNLQPKNGMKYYRLIFQSMVTSLNYLRLRGNCGELSIVGKIVMEDRDRTGTDQSISGMIMIG